MNLNTKNNPSIIDDFPTLITFDNISDGDFVIWYNQNKETIDKILQFCGAILYRGINIKTTETFDEIISGISTNFLDYKNGNSPRTRLSTNVYTSTEYDSDYDITLHNELSYSSQFPSKIYFCCLKPAIEGGETPIADARKIFTQLDPKLSKKLLKGISYIRNFDSGKGLRTSWQDTYETDDVVELEAYLKDNNLEFTWIGKDKLRVIETLPAVRIHPDTQEYVWFNQIDQFHPSHLQPEILEMLLMMSNNDEMALPKYVTFSDGEKISDEIIASIRSTVDSNAINITWQAGDLLMLDNMLSCHGRKAYKGDRKVLVAMSN